MNLYLVLPECGGAVYEIDEDEADLGPPSGIYGLHWTAVRAETVGGARSIGLSVFAGDADGALVTGELTHSEALAAYGHVPHSEVRP